jgi:hypothetical protein
VNRLAKFMRLDFYVLFYLYFLDGCLLLSKWKDELLTVKIYILKGYLQKNVETHTVLLLAIK